MSAVDFTFHGDEEILRKLDLEQPRVRRAVAAASLSVVESFLDEVKTKLPFDTGRYSRSGFSEEADTRYGDHGATGGFAVPYAWFVEQLHPRNPFVITRTWVQMSSEMRRQFAELSRTNIRDDVEKARKRYPTRDQVVFDPPLGVRGNRRGQR